MSLFPAYSAAVTDSSDASVPAKPDDLHWLTNQSFIAFPIDQPAPASGADRSCSAESSSQQQQQPATATRKRKQKKKRKKHKTHHSGSEDEADKKKGVAQKPVRVSEEEFYTDLEGLRIYLTVDTLHKPACPRYKLGPYRFNSQSPNRKNGRKLRYFKYLKPFNSLDVRRKAISLEKESELEKAARDDNSVAKWIEYFHYKVDNPVHMDSYQNHKAELSIVEKAMRQHPDNNELLTLWLDQIVKVFPTDEVLEMIERLISKDNTNVLLWDALIANKQGAMAQCIAPNVLRLYEKSIRSLFLAKRSDEVMLKFFKKCSLFCRQSGLWEKFFGLVQLTVSLNMSTEFANKKQLFASPEHYTQLIEYEELILKSGLPMNEIWLRIEKLRGAFHFLPFEGAKMCGDPQRMILQEDIVGFVYPLINREYTFDLAILILKLMKYPFESNAFERCSFFKPEAYEADHSEQLLPLFLEINRNTKYDITVLSLIKELNTPPSYINTNLAFESYLDLMRELIVALSVHFTDEKHAILLLLYLKLERILIVFDKISDSLSESRKKSCRSRVKNLLKKSNNPNNLRFYIEYGLIEYEMEGWAESCIKIFNISAQVFFQNDASSEDDLFALILSVTDILIKEKRKEQAVYLLTTLALNPSKIRFDETFETPSDPVKLLALQKFNERAARLLMEEDQIECIPLEYYFTANPLINAIKAYLYCLALVKSTTETIKKLEGFLFQFNNTADQRHLFVREHLYEIYLKILTFRIEEFTNNSLLQAVDRVLHEFPENMTAIRFCAFLDTISWFQIRTTLGKYLTVRSVLLLTVTGRTRSSYDINDPDGEQLPRQTYKRRLLNLLKHSVRRESTLRQNALLWRLYLRELFDQPSSVNPAATTNGQDNVLEQCRKTLYMALEACPWNKALYLDGAFFAPQELSHLLDLLMEKQLRIHAIPEELEILRNE
ncbi:nuclear exosome regulator NRDE2 [Sabethes cyaneus]|uniref:nuclear exosome regulator NRDE2 n=1 Tax=Sabethes cyaneus TaxID=53552 RepID=UPI00237E1813|nr:nuclear exosome regulator NRDE2 [Sabethes cyaneus]